MVGVVPMKLAGIMGWVAVNEGEKLNSIVYNDETLNRCLRSTSSQRAYKKVEQPICMQTG
jgi:hypothetical protein